MSKIDDANKERCLNGLSAYLAEYIESDESKLEVKKIHEKVLRYSKDLQAARDVEPEAMKRVIGT